jgi:hypothetical protein
MRYRLVKVQLTVSPFRAPLSPPDRVYLPPSVLTLHSPNSVSLCLGGKSSFFIPFPDIVPSLLPVSTFRMNTYKTITKQTTLTPFRMNTYAKPGGRGPLRKSILAHRVARLRPCRLLPIVFRFSRRRRKMDSANHGD